MHKVLFIMWPEVQLKVRRYIQPIYFKSFRRLTKITSIIPKCKFYCVEYQSNKTKNKYSLEIAPSNRKKAVNVTTTKIQNCAGLR